MTESLVLLARLYGICKHQNSWYKNKIFKCEQQIFSLLVVNLERFDEKNKDEADAVHNTLGIYNDRHFFRTLSHSKLQSDFRKLAKKEYF